MSRVGKFFMVLILITLAVAIITPYALITLTGAGLRAVERDLTPSAKPGILVTYARWEIPPAYHGNPYAPGGVGGAMRYIHGRFFGYDIFKREYWPYLATKYELVPGEKLTVHLRSNVRWEDGKPFTSKDVYTAFIMGGAVWTWSPIWRHLERIETPDEYTVVFVLDKAMPSILVAHKLLCEIALIAPYHWYEKWMQDAEKIVRLRREMWAREDRKEYIKDITEEIDKILVTFKESLHKFRPRMPMSNGPFRVKEVKADVMILVRRDDQPWAKTMLINELHLMRCVPTESMWAMMIAGKWDVSNPVTPKEMVEVIFRAQPGAYHILVPDFSTLVIALNHRRWPLRERAFRQALAYILDRDTIRKISFYYGITTKLMSGLPPSVVKMWTTPELRARLKEYQVNHTKAEELLKGLGLKKEGGIWVRPDGTPLTFEILVPAECKDWVLGAEEVARQLTAFGIKTTTLALVWEVFDTRVRREPFDYDMAFEFGVFAKIHPVTGFERLFLKCVRIITGFDARITLPDGREVNLAELTEKLWTEMDPKKQIEIIDDLSWGFNEYLPVICLFERTNQIFLLDGVRVTGWPLHDIEEIRGKLAWYWRYGKLKWIMEGVLKPAK